MDNLQKIITKKAEERLRKDIQELSAFLYNKNNALLNDTRINIGSSEKPRSIHLKWIFEKDNLGETIYNNNIERYIEEESKAFVEKVTSLQSELENLMGQQQFDNGPY